MAPSHSMKKTKMAHKKGLARHIRMDMCEHCSNWFKVCGLGSHQMACGWKIQDADGVPFTLPPETRPWPAQVCF